MPADTFVVYVSVDPHFGERIGETIPPGSPGWVIDSPANRPVIERLWRERPSESQLQQVSSFAGNGEDPAEQEFLAELGMIDLHFGAHSSTPPYAELNVIGVSATPAVRAAVEACGLRRIEATEAGFRAFRE